MPLPDARRSDVVREICDHFGFAPRFYDSLPDRGVAAAWMVQRDLELSDRTVLDNKTKELIGLAVAAHIKCKYCVYFHTEAARAFGASDQELREAAMMGGTTVLYSNALTGAQVDFDAFRADVDRAMANLTAEAEPV